MKRTMILMMIIGMSILGIAQDSSHRKVREDVSLYIETAVYPILKQQKDNYLSLLSDTEKNEILALKNACQKNQKHGKGNKGNGSRGAGKRNNKIDRAERIATITDAHPELNEEYISIINSHKQNWIADIENIHNDHGIEAKKHNDGKRGYESFFERISNPDFLLMWDPERSKSGDHSSSRKRKGAKANNISGELKEELKVYAVENIIPVISEERLNFDLKLSDTEKETIETARQKIKVRKTMFNSWYASEDFVPGKRAKDPNFDSMREDMRNSMDEVRKIAKDHQEELRTSMKSISEHKDEWRSELSDIAIKHGVEKGDIPHSQLMRLHKVKSPLQFLLFDPNKSKSEFLADNDKVRVMIYPNPIYVNGTIAVIGAVDMDIKISVYTKNGELIKELYNAVNKEERLEVVTNFDDFDTDVYIVKITYGENEISRKIIVKK